MTLTFIDCLFYLFSMILILSSTLVITAKNQVYGVLFLILAFFNAAGLCVLIGAEFIAMMLVIVYVGAVAVLFLFVVMMLELKGKTLQEGLVKYYPLALLVGGILLVEFLLFLFRSPFQETPAIIDLPSTASGLTNAHQIGQVLYTDYFLIFQLVGLVLLAAMVAAIALTLHHGRDSRRQNVGDQLKRKASETVHLVKVQPKLGGEKL